MNRTERQYSPQIAEMMRASRKIRGLTQTDIAKELGITQGTLSKIEKGTLVVSTPIWFQFCDMMNISPRSFLLGYIDEPEPESIRVDASASENSFDLPRNYEFSKGCTVRGIRGLVDYARKVWGKKKFEAFLATKHIDPDFFLILTNQINLQFTYDLLEALRDSGDLSSETLRSLAKAYSSPAFHGSMGICLENSKSPKELLATLIEKIDRYEINFDCKVVTHQSDAEISTVPAPFVAAFNTVSEIAKAFCEFRTYFFEETLHISSKEAHVEHTHCVYKGQGECRYQVQF